MPELQSSKNINAIDISVSKKLKMRRIMCGLSQADLGEAVNVSIQQIQKYEKGINRISAGKLLILAKLLKVPISYFFENATKLDGDSLYAAEDGEAYQHQAKSKSDNGEVNEKEILNIIKVFSEVKDPSIRRKIFELIKTLNV